MVKCLPLPKLESKYLVGDVFALLIEAQSKYQDCSTIHNNLVDMVKEREIK